MKYFIPIYFFLQVLFFFILIIISHSKGVPYAHEATQLNIFLAAFFLWVKIDSDNEKSKKL